MGLKDGYQRPAGALFYKIGLSSFDADNHKPVNDSFVENNYNNKNPLWNLRKLSSIAKQLNHSNRTLDILKIDTEGSEILALEQALNDGYLQRNVKQVLIEWHLWKMALKKDHASLRKVFDVYNRMFANGFRMFFLGENSYRNVVKGIFPFTCLVNTKLFS